MIAVVPSPPFCFGSFTRRSYHGRAPRGSAAHTAGAMDARGPGPALLALLVGLGCGPAAAPDAGGMDAAASDAGFDAGAEDAGAPDAGRDAGAAATWMRYERADGTVVEGEPIHAYDHSRWWWMASDETTRAVFDPRRLAAWPDDRSMAFLADSSVVSATPIPAPPGARAFDRAMRDAGYAIDRVPLDGVAWVITGHERYHLEETGYGDFAWDLVRLDERGNRFDGDGTANEDYLVWDAEVFAPVSGVVVEVVGDAPDVPPGPVDLDAVNNLVGIQVHGAYYVYLLHLRQGSIPPEIVPGARVEAGDRLGRVGNSGVSAEPHLHLTGLALDHDADPVRTWSVPVEWRDVWIGSGRAPRRAEWAVPATGDYLSNEAF